MISRSALVVVMLTLTLTGFQKATGSAGAPAPTGIAPCDSNRFMMTGTRGVLEVIHVYPGVTADTSTPPLRSLRGEHTTLCSPRDLAVDRRGRLHVMSRNNVISVFEAGAAGDAEPIKTLEMPAIAIGLDRRDNTYVVTWESPPSDSGSILVFERGAAGERRPSRMLAGPRTGLRRPYGVAVDAEGRIYVTNEAGDTVRIFGRGANGNVPPVAYLTGPLTGLGRPYGLAFDSRGYLYVANAGANVVTVYRPGSSGNVAPVWTTEAHLSYKPQGRPFSGPTFLALDSHDTLYVRSNGHVWVFGPHSYGRVTPVRSLLVPDPHGLAVGRDGMLYIANRNGRVSVFAPGASDSAAPVRVIEDPDERGVLGVALGAADTLYAADIEDIAVRVYRPGAGGAAVPVRSLSGPRTRLGDPRGIVLDRRGTLYVANGPSRKAARGAIRVYAPSTTDTAMPLRIIRGGQTLLSQPGDVAIDSRGYIYAVNRGESYTDNTEGSVTVYAPDATGDAEPIRRIAGPNTLLREPSRLAIGPGDTLYVLNAFGGTGPTYKYGFGNVSITVYSPRSNGDVEPVRTITVTGGQTIRGGRFPTGIAVDTRGAVFLSDYASEFVSVYAPGAGGEAIPERRVRIGPAEDANGRAWSYMGATAVAIGPRDELFVAAFPRQMVFTSRGPSSNAPRDIATGPEDAFPVRTIEAR
ncbi:MAG TPA: hypothetical protein VIG08_14305 [Gemmatimonadales bacterium]